MSKKILLVVVIALIIVVGGGVVGVATGYLYVGSKMPNQKVLVQSAGCNVDIIERFNKAIREFDVKPVDAKTVADEATKVADYRSDANCVYIAYSYAQLAGDKTKAREYYDLQKNLTSQGKYPSNQFDDLQGLNTMLGVVEFLEGKNNSTEDAPLGSG